MRDDGLTYLLWSDLVGVTRTRGVPSRDLDRRARVGLGWAMAGQALTPFTDIVANDWGPMDEARQIPDMATQFIIPGDDANPSIAGVICNSMTADGEPWECCVRQFCARALADLRAETGFDLMASFEHEFTLWGDGQDPQTPFSFAAARQRHRFLEETERLLDGAGLVVETLEPEYGLGQYEVSVAPEPALRAADHALVLRETVRESARRQGLKASFTPKFAPDAVGNGVHLHLSLADPERRNVTADPAGPAGLSPMAAAFAAGVLAHAGAVVALTAPSPVSYRRLGPHHWSCGFAALGVQNREAMLRVIPGAGPDPAARARGFNIEYRPCDATASPYLALGAVVRAGLEGIRRGLEAPVPVGRDPADMSGEERARAGIRPLPATLAEAADALAADRVAAGWMAPRMRATYLALKRWEAERDAAGPEASFARYAAVY